MANTFSAIVPFHNTAMDQVKTCLRSLLAQDLGLVKEIVVVNDGSDEEHTARIAALVDELNTHTHTGEI